MKLNTSENADPNYLAVVVKMPEIKPHPNADRLCVVEVFGNSIIIAKDMYTEGEIVCYFPVESCLSTRFLSWANLYDKPDLNADGKTKGFFNNKGNRVKAVSLRSMPSQGFLYKVDKLAEYYNTKPTDFKVGVSFDTVGDDKLVTKYIRPESNSGQVNVKKSKIPAWVNNTMGYLPKPVRRLVYIPIKYYYGLNSDDGIKSQIVNGQFKFHYKTEHLGKNIWLISPEDEITITAKVHGCVKYDTPIETLEYGILPINVIVDHKIPVHVRGYDIDTNTVKWVKVDDYYYKKDDGEWYEIELDDGTKLTITGNNPVWMPELSCYRKVENLVVGDDLLVESFK